MRARSIFAGGALVGLGFLAGVLVGPAREATYQRLWGESSRQELARQDAAVKNLQTLNDALLLRCQENRN